MEQTRALSLDPVKTLFQRARLAGSTLAHFTSQRLHSRTSTVRSITDGSIDRTSGDKTEIKEWKVQEG